MLGVLLTKWTIRLALACFVAYLGGWLVLTGPRWRQVSRWLWTIGCGLFLIHVACAFQFYHHWSHAAAWESTARETEELLGVSFGDGIYFSYVFAVVWVVDMLGLWLAGAAAKPSFRRTALGWLRGAALAFLLFIAFNGAIVFEGGPTRWFGIVACLALAASAGRWLHHWWRNSQDTAAAAKVREPEPITECGLQNAD
ncbi:MAG: hypothetical protein SFU86_11870 [Pirellulaceae bacterium]|nr:hypothetical protein [Pirellulaceae bacterium]